MEAADERSSVPAARQGPTSRFYGDPAACAGGSRRPDPFQSLGSQDCCRLTDKQEKDMINEKRMSKLLALTCIIILD